jgi:hypothetical protein
MSWKKRSNCLECYYSETNIKIVILVKLFVWSPIIATFSISFGHIHLKSRDI